MISLRRVHAAFRGYTPRPKAGVFERHSRAFESAQLLVRVYQAILLFWACSSLPDWPVHMARRNLILLWPSAWVRLVGEPLGWSIVLWLYLIGPLLGVMLPRARWARVLSWLAVFQHAAMVNSTGKVYHDLHVVVLTSFVLIFLPDITKTPAPGAARATRYRYTMVFWSAQAILMLTYTMAGLGKIAYSVWHIARGEYSDLHPQGLAIHVAENLIDNHKATLLGPWLLDHAPLAWPLMLGAIYTQFFAVWAICRPALHRWWGLGLLGFHIGTGVFMAILTPTHALLLGVLIMASPFAAPGEWSTREALCSLPIFGRAVRWRLARLSSAPR